MSESKFYHFSKSGKSTAVNSSEQALSLMNNGFVWFDFYDPKKEDLMALTDATGIHPLSIEDCFDESHLPKIDLFVTNTFIIINSFSYADQNLHIDEIAFFIGEKFLITVSGHNSGGRKPLGEIRRIIETDAINAKGNPAQLMHIIIDFVVDQKFFAFDILEDEIDKAEDDVLDNPETFKASDLIRIRKNLLSLRKSIFHEREILIRITRSDSQFIPEKAIVHYRDIYDHLTKFFEMTETFRDVLTSLLELYTSLLNNIMTKSANETNIAVRRLTLIATIFMPLTLIASIGGMSEWTMITGTENWKTSYPLFILGMVIFGIINYYLIKRMERRQ